MSALSFLLFALAACALIWTFLVWRGFTQTWLPEDLKGATLVLVEKNLITDVPVPVVGRPDQVYRLHSGHHVPVENKNRDSYRVYGTDIAQLSLQAWLLRKTGRITAPYGYVVVNSRITRTRKCIRVNLYSETTCLHIIQRYLDVIDGAVTARKSIGVKCKNCGHKAECHAT